MKNILILEDNPAQRDALSLIVQEVSSEIKIYAVGTVEEALTIVFKNHIDIFMVDIIIYPDRQGDTSGVHFVEKIRGMEEYKFTPVIFTTTLEDPQLYAYKRLKCEEYIEKPYEREQVKEVVKKCLDFPSNPQKKNQQIIFREDGILWPISIDEILCIESSNHVLYVYRNNGETNKFPYRPIKAILEEIGETVLIQCGRGTLVNREYIRNIDIINGYIELEGMNDKVNIGFTYKKRLKEIFEVD